jgi:hypothetical protein
VDGLHVLLQNRIKKPLAIVLSGVEEDQEGEAVRSTKQCTT